MHLCLQTVTLNILLWQGLRADLTNQRFERPQTSFLVGVEHCIIGQKFTVHNLMCPDYRQPSCSIVMLLPSVPRWLYQTGLFPVSEAC